MKLNLLVIGNKPIANDIGDLVDSFDYVIRVSRMNNFKATREKINGLFLEANQPFKYHFNGGEFKSYFTKASKVFMCPFWYDRFTEWPEYLTEDQYKTIELIDDKKIAEIVGFNRLTSSIRIIAHLLNSSWKDEFNIHFTAIDVENRNQFVDNNPYWNYHKGAGIIEKDYLLEQIRMGNLIRIENE